MNKLLAAAIALVALLLTGCGSTPEISAIETTVTSTVTVTEEAPAPPPVTVTETVDNSEFFEENMDSFMGDPDMQRAALQLSWDQMSSSDQADICLGWGLTDLRPQLLDQFMSSSEDMFERDVVEDYFNEVCG